MRKLLWLANILVLGALALALCSPYVSPTSFWPVSFFGLAFPTLYLLGLGFLAFWIFKTSKYLWPNVVVLALAAGNVTQYIGFNSPAQEQADLTVLTYNMFGGALFYTTDSLAFRQNQQAFAQLGEVDVMAIQETPRYKPSADALWATLDSMGLRYHYEHPEHFVTLHARYPLINPRLVDSFTNANAIVAADLALPAGDTVSVFAAHLQSNFIRLDAEQVLKDAAKARKRAYWKIRSVARNYRKAVRLREQQAKRFVKAAQAVKYPVILLGDLNDTPMSYPIAIIRESGLQDAFYERGKGLGVSYPGTIPGLRIDYVFVDPAIEILETKVRPHQLSDHKPVLAKLKLTR